MTTKVVNGKIQYFIKGQRVKPNEYYKFRSEISNKTMIDKTYNCVSCGALNSGSNTECGNCKTKRNDIISRCR